MMQSLQINRYLPIALIYFFFNSFLLPLGLLYTTLLTPLFIVWLYRYPTFNYLGIFFFASLPFIAVHFLNGVDFLVYLKSYVLLFTVFVFGVAFYQFLRLCTSLGEIFKSISIINFLFVLLAIVALAIPVVREIFWYKNYITVGVEKSYRLKLFTYEASYYSLLMIPIALFYYLKVIFLPYKNRWFTVFVITLPLVLSMSFGVIAGLAIALFLLFCSDFRLFLLKKHYLRHLIIAATVLLFLLFIAIQLYPDNVVFVRIANVFSGKDTSFNGRTVDSLYLGWRFAAEKSILFGAGPGQLKVFGLEIYSNFYKYNNFTADNVIVPNSFGDTLAHFGVLGAVLKLALVVYFFFKTSVYNNLYRLGLFIFILIYQFTGSYIMNIVEYAIWIMAFYPTLFPEFNKENILGNQNRPVQVQPAVA